MILRKTKTIIWKLSIEIMMTLNVKSKFYQITWWSSRNFVERKPSSVGMEIMNTTENAPSAKKLQMIINSGISKNSNNWDDWNFVGNYILTKKWFSTVSKPLVYVLILSLKTFPVVEFAFIVDGNVVQRLQTAQSWVLSVLESFFTFYICSVWMLTF